MYLPPIKINKEKVSRYTAFMGYSERDKIDDTQLAHMVNMSDEALPAATPRKGRKAVASVSGITNLCAPEYKDADLSTFTGVADGYFYYMGEKVDNKMLTSGDKEIVDFNGKICIFPDKVFYSYLPDPVTGEVNKTLQDMEKSMTVTKAKFFSEDDETTGLYLSHIMLSGASFNTFFKKGDSLVISGCKTKPNNNTYIADGSGSHASDKRIVTAIVENVKSDHISFILYDKAGRITGFEKTSTENGTVKIGVHIPEMNHICVHNNRLWGTSASGNMIYASKLGDCQSFSYFMGGSDDSWYSAIGTAGGFTGIVSYRGGIVAFKRNYIHHIYGDSPKNFSIPKQTVCGTTDGKSIVEVGGILYFLSGTGFFAYSGGEPYPISEELSQKYYACVAGTDGKRYYACAKKAERMWELLVYNPAYGTWHKEDNNAFVDFLTYRDKLYGATNKAVYVFGEGNETVNWQCVSKKITTNTFRHKGAYNVFLRLDMKKKAKVNIYISHDDDDFALCGTIEGTGFLQHKVPVRFRKCDSFRIMLQGSGEVVIHDMEIVQYVGGETNEV